MSADFRLSLAPYQQRAVDAMSETLRTVSTLHSREPEHRTRISRELGVTLLQAPTGSGKTLILGRTLEAVRGQLDTKTVWFWFAPYAGLVTQTRSALIAQCAGLRQRDVYADREASAARDGDVYVQTWASVAVIKKASRKVRTDKEASLSVDSMIAELRERGFRIGVVIDEAHLNFGSGAAATAEFFLNVLSPDFTILATATPNDAKLEKFERDAGLKVASRVTVARDAVVKAGLNKIGLMVGVLRFKEEDRALIDTEVATLTAGWSQHSFIKDRLAEKGISVTPLMLVQVEDQLEGQEDPVARVKERLIEIGVPAKAIAVHTSGEPDPAFHTLAYDPEIEVLVFKLAVATGFDAPRAWTLVSVRPSRGRDFGLQIVGRIMRVHPLVRPLHGTEPLLDRGYVFLSDPDVQGGLDEAAADLKAVREGIAVLTDTLDVNVLGNDERAAESYGATPLPPPPVQPVDGETQPDRIERQVSMGLLNPNATTVSAERQQSALDAVEGFSAPATPPLFPDLPDVLSPRVTPPARAHTGEMLLPLLLCGMHTFVVPPAAGRLTLARPSPPESRSPTVRLSEVNTKLLAADATLVFAYSFARTLANVLIAPDFPGWLAPVTADPLRLSTTVGFAGSWALAWACSGLLLGAFSASLDEESTRRVGARGAATAAPPPDYP